MSWSRAIDDPIPLPLHARPDVARLPMKPSEIRPGFYYEKQGHPGWLRLFLGIRDGYAAYVDFTGYGQCRLDNLARWASRGHTPWEATERFPEEVTRITAIRDQHPKRD
jgi:hypothetical protein